MMSNEQMKYSDLKSGKVVIMMEARICQLYTKPEDYEIIERCSHEILYIINYNYISLLH